ncbi:c-type cytochrome domain-containing protein [Maribacter confluentis]|uniref:C-type cytochrome domain-containing protein n=1 Tax=Maribacter confluentis TaxID=1656093 RepID=A0ABT8RS39_9FLAO|nr:c-type cytochrome domain-containing protein [Maribacter confluentis]MDO1513713.1 c-type cytochrome domain-containing protein [Maribacter confluentis]
MDILKQLLGRLHPLVVHLPIGFIIAGLLLQLVERKKKEFTKVISLIYLWGAYVAVLACITGYLQYLGEGHSFNSVEIHLWSGIATALCCFILWARLATVSFAAMLQKIPVLVISGLLFVLISFTGHQGGNITHGEDYLVEPLPNTLKAALGYTVFEEKEIILSETDWESAVFYTDVIAPILNNNCVSCHNPKKAKGELLLHSEEGILTSGENGPVLTAHHPGESDLFLRMELPKSNDRHMPPDGKRQPSKEAIKLVETWIAKGHPFTTTIGELKLPKSLFAPYFPKSEVMDYPPTEIAAAATDSIHYVKNFGLHVAPISEGTNYLKVSALNLPTFTNADAPYLNAIAPQIALLDLGGTQITDDICTALAKLPNLTRVQLDHTQLTGSQLEQFKSLQYLKSINLSYTNFKEEYLSVLTEFKALEKVVLFNPEHHKTGTEYLNNGKTAVEYGNYTLPVIASDSIVY